VKGVRCAIEASGTTGLFASVEVQDEEGILKNRRRIQERTWVAPQARYVESDQTLTRKAQMASRV
jgi:hypothetical protein